MSSRLLAVCLFVLTFLPVARAQQPVPEIEFESVPDFLKLPDDIHLGEVSGVAVDSKGRIFVFSRSGSASGPAFGPVAAQLLEFSPTGEFIREIGKNLYGWAFAHTVRIDRNDNIWAIDKGSDMVIRFNRAGRVEWVFGRRKESADGAEPWEHVTPPAAAGGRSVPPADRRGVGLAGQHLHQRRLRQLARREVRQERRLGEVVRRARQGPRTVQHAARHRDRQTRTTSTSAIAATSASRSSTPTASTCASGRSTIPPDYTTRAVNGPTPPAGSPNGVGAPNSLCITPGPNQVIFLGESTWPGRIFKVTLDGKVLGVIGKSGRNLGQFSGAHQLACPSEHEIYVAESSNWRVQKLVLSSAASALDGGAVKAGSQASGVRLQGL